MSGVLEQILDRLTKIEEAVAARPAAGAPAAAAEPVRRGRGRPAGSAKKEEPPAPASDGNFLDESPEPVKPPTKDQVRAALVAYNKKHNSEQKTRAILKNAGGVDNLSALPEEKYAAVIAAAQE